MQFQNHLRNIKEMAEAEEERVMPPTAKVDINELLFRLLPPKTTIDDLDDLALAVFATVQDAWAGRL